MSRYIDADKLLNPDNIIVMQDETGIDEFPYTYTNAVKVETILSAPTADVVEVVRCRDCKHRYVPCRCALWFGMADGKEYFVERGEDFYCSYGERREE